VAIICDHQKRIRYINTKYSGSAHDALIWKESRIRHHMEEQWDNGNPMHLVGDEAYGASRVMLTKTRRAQRARFSEEFASKAKKYDQQIVRLRSTVEHTFGMLKRRFLCLHTGLRCRQLERSRNIIRE
jgi:hypothetical protein